jgi:S1-C subfamily serine protease
MLQSPAADSVKSAIIRLRGALTEVAEATRVREDLERLAVRLAEIGSNEREARIQITGIGAEMAARIRPVTARVVGRSFVGGAQFNDLNPQLGEYFGTDHGLLVIQVLSGTPCDEAGLVPGDVVTHVGDTEINSVEEFRAVLNQAFAGGRSADLTLIRRGERVAATLSR